MTESSEKELPCLIFFVQACLTFVQACLNFVQVFQNKRGNVQRVLTREREVFVTVHVVHRVFLIVV